MKELLTSGWIFVAPLCFYIVCLLHFEKKKAAEVARDKFKTDLSALIVKRLIHDLKIMAEEIPNSDGPFSKIYESYELDDKFDVRVELTLIKKKSQFKRGIEMFHGKRN